MGDGSDPVVKGIRSSTPKLMLSSLPSKAFEHPGMLTPPLQTPVSIPFQWEEAPGKPRATAASYIIRSPSKSKAVRCLDLPPRLLAESQVTNMPSPMTVLDGPYVQSRSLSQTLSFSLGRRSPFGSWRWGSFRETKDVVKGRYDFSSTASVGANHTVIHTQEKIRKIGRKNSFLNFAPLRSNLLASLCGSFKQAVPWRRGQEKLRKMSV